MYILSQRKRETRGFSFPYKSDPAGQNVSSEPVKPDYHLILEDGRRQKNNIYIY